MQKAAGRPNLVLVLRDGDPRAAVAAVVVTGGNSYASTGLSALLEARLQKSGFPSVDAIANRESFRLRALVETPERAGAFVTAVHRALATPVARSGPEMQLVARRLTTLRRHPVEAPIAVSVARCTGELGVLATEPPLDPSSNEGAAQLEAARSAAYGASRVAFGAVGGASIGEAVSGAVRGGDKWPRTAPPDSTLSSNDQVGTFASVERTQAGPRVVLATTAQRAETAIATALQLGTADGTLVTRLRALGTPFRVVDATATARQRGGCLAVTLEPVRPSSGSGFEESAALAAVVARQEMERTRAAVGAAPSEPTPSAPLGFEGSRAVRLASDPREAAELAALWSLTTPASPNEKEATSVALALPASWMEGRGTATEPGAQLAASARRFGSTIERLEKSWTAPVLEHREHVERGQGELWLLLASPCGTMAEGESDAGLTSLSLMTALAGRPRESRGVSLEPWIAADGVGVVAHGARLPGESAAGMAMRIAEEAARTLAAPPFSAPSFASARATLLQRVGDGISSDGRALDALAGSLVPGHPSWLAPLGSWDDLAKAGVEAASLRWAALSAGPLRLAVLANDGRGQADAVVRAIDRWIVRTEQPRACSPAEPAPAAKAGTVPIAVPSPPPLSQALLGVPVAPQGSAETGFAELTLAGLSGADGWLTKALSSPSLSASAQARLVGGTRAAALVVDIRAPESTLDAAVAQVRGLLQRLRQGSMGTGDFDRSSALRERWELEGSLDPRRRLVDLWRDARPGPRPPLSLDGWRAWAAASLRDDRLVIVLARPKR